jgi:hypothetical protein
MKADSRSAGRGSRVGIQAARASLQADASAFLNACGLRAWTLNMASSVVIQAFTSHAVSHNQSKSRKW